MRKANEKQVIMQNVHALAKLIGDEIEAGHDATFLIKALRILNKEAEKC